MALVGNPEFLVAMPDIKPQNPHLLTDEDVEYSHFHCCGDEDLVFLRCPACGHIWVMCYECETWYPDLRDPQQQTSASAAAVPHCPRCQVPFGDRFYLQPGIVDRYLPMAEQVIQAGFGAHLSQALRAHLGISARKR